MAKQNSESVAKAGRPKTGNIQISIRLPREALDRLNELAARHYCTKSQILTKLVMLGIKSMEDLEY